MVEPRPFKMSRWHATSGDDSCKVSDALAAHDVAPPDRVLASSSRGKTTRVPWDEKSDAVVKETRWAGLEAYFKRLARLGRTSRALRAFRASVALEERGVSVASPLSYAEDETDRACFVARYIDGERLDRALASRLERGDESGARELAIQAAQLAARIHAAGVAHGDLKPMNLILAKTGLVAIDLDAASVGAKPPSLRARAKDLGALDAYSQRGSVALSVRSRLAALEAYPALAPFESSREALLRAVLKRSRWKRDRWRTARA